MLVLAPGLQYTMPEASDGTEAIDLLKGILFPTSSSPT